MASRVADFGCNTYSYNYAQRADACVERLISYGFQKFELMAHPGNLWPPSPNADGLSELRRALDQGSARVVTLNMPNIDINIAAAGDDMRDYSLGILEGIVRLAGELGASGVVIGPGKANPLFPADAEKLLPHFFAALDRLAPIAKASGTELWAENMPFSFLPGIDALVDALDRHSDPSIGIIYDVANAHFISEDIHAGLKRSGSRLRLVHLSDTGRQAYRHDPIGMGDVPFAAIPSMLRDVGYRSKTMLEIISRDPDADLIDSVTRLAAMGF